MQDNIRKKLSEIANIFEGQNYIINSNGLMGGKTGIALFLLYYSRLTNNKKYSEIAFDLIFDAFNSINNGFKLHTFANGIAGIGWTVEHLIQNNFLEKDTSNVLDNIDNFMYRTMMTDIKNGNYDFLHGAIGNGTYFLNRLNKDESKKCLGKLVEELGNISETEEDGSIKWESELDIKSGVRGYNISLSHGIASIITFLSKLYDENICKEHILMLLNGSVKYLLKQEIEKREHESMFPSYALESNSDNTSSRLGWCYGDLGIGTALWQVAQSTQKKVLENKALEILLYSTTRKDLDKNRVFDAGLCHGTAGIAQIYNRMHYVTGISEFKNAKTYWFNETLKKAMYKNGYAGYKAWRSADHGGLTKDPSLLEGIAGIGLAMISAVSDIEPKWDRCLLLS